MTTNNGSFIIKVSFFNGHKFHSGAKVVNEVTYEKVKSYREVNIPKEIILGIGVNENEIDPENEYLILEFKNGSNLMLRNSMVEGVNCGYEEE